MNLAKFLALVDKTSENMELTQLKSFIHDTARVIPETMRTDFLERLENQFNCAAAKGDKDAISENNKLKYMELKEKLSKIEDWEMCLIGELNEEYDDWYNSDEDEFIFYDPEKIGQVIIEAVQYLDKCIDEEMFQEGCEIANTIIDIKIMVGGEYQDYSYEPLDLEDLCRYKLAKFDYKSVIIDSLYLVYCGTPLKEKAKRLYEMTQAARIENVTLEDIMQRGEELHDFEEFLPLWITFLGDKNTRVAHLLLLEAMELSNSPESFLENARRFYEQHPSLYEKYLIDNQEKSELSDLIEVGKEALSHIPSKYIIRSRIALQMADFLIQKNKKITDEVEMCWLEAYKSDTSVTNYLRLMLNSRDFAKWNNEMQLINHEMLKHSKKENTYYYTKSDELQENCLIANEVYLIALLNGEYKFVKEKGMNCKEALGWSSSFMKQGLAGFLLLLIENTTLQQGGDAMLSKILFESQFKTADYVKGQGKMRNASVDDKTMLWECFLKVKSMVAITSDECTYYMKWIEKLIEKRVDGIMENNRRNYYGECAAYIATIGEVKESLGQEHAKQRIMTDYKAKYNRRRVFHQELRAYGMADK